ncbi:MAG: porin, partial [Thiogranum sp.]|nr:porin [Thiogranum sp.]
MNKKLIATAMGLAMAGGMSLATADVKLYGQIDLSIDAIDQDGGVDDVNMGSNTSAVGVKGSEDLGNGLSAIFKLEWQVDVDDADLANSGYEDESGAGGFTGRDQWLGLKGESWGQLTFGTMSTTYKSSAAAIDPFYRTRNQARNIGLHSSLHSGKGEEGQGRATNTVRYDSPSFGGVAFAGTYTLDNSEAGGAEDDDPYSVGLTYKGGPVYAFVDYITTSGGGDDDAVQIGAKATFGGAAIYGIYEMDGGLITLRQ